MPLRIGQIEPDAALILSHSDKNLPRWTAPACISANDADSIPYRLAIGYGAVSQVEVPTEVFTVGARFDCPGFLVLTDFDGCVGNIIRRMKKFATSGHSNEPISCRIILAPIGILFLTLLHSRRNKLLEGSIVGAADVIIRAVDAIHHRQYGDPCISTLFYQLSKECLLRLLDFGIAGCIGVQQDDCSAAWTCELHKFWRRSHLIQAIPVRVLYFTDSASPSPAAARSYSDILVASPRRPRRYCQHGFLSFDQDDRN